MEALEKINKIIVLCDENRYVKLHNGLYNVPKSNAFWL